MYVCTCIIKVMVADRALVHSSYNIATVYHTYNYRYKCPILGFIKPLNFEVA